MNKIKLKQKMSDYSQLLIGLIIVGFLVLKADVVKAADIKQVRYAMLPGDKVQLDLEIDGAVTDPGVFSTADPARVAFDFFGASKSFTESLIKVGVGNVDSVVAVETDDRTRIIVNLINTASYSSEITSTGYAITLDGPSYSTPAADIYTDYQTSTAGTFAYQSELVASEYINSVDFRRSSNGGGKLVVDLSSPSTSVNVKDQVGKIRLDFRDATLSGGLEKRLDVVDFATPVDSIDVFQNGSDVSMIVDSNAKYRQISYQSGNQFTLIIDPFVETAQEKQERQESENEYTGERLSINFQKIEVRAALAVISDFTGKNIVTSDDVQGELTLNLKDIPWDQALDVILKTKGLDKRENGDVIYIAPSSVLVKQEREEKAALEAKAEVVPMVSEVIRINYANAEEIKEVILGQDDSNSASNGDSGTTVINFGNEPGKDKEQQASTESKLKVTADARSNSLLITTTAANMLSLKKLIKKLDRPLRQVLVETRIVEATDDFSKELGARLGFQRITDNPKFPGSGNNIADQSYVGASTGAPTSLIDEGLTSENRDPGLGSLGLGNGGRYGLQLFKAGNGYSNLISLELAALELEGRGKVVASPRLLAADNQEASIKQGEVQILEGIESASSAGGEDGGGAATTTKTSEREAVLGLTVKPKITPDDRVILQVKVNQDRFITDERLSTKEIKTQVLLDNGETIVIGGVYTENESTNVTKVPVLGDIPVVKHLFRKNNSSRGRTELLIFLTPKIINESLGLQ